jgi:hypothetical protein
VTHVAGRNTLDVDVGARALPLDVDVRHWRYAGRGCEDARRPGRVIKRRRIIAPAPLDVDGEGTKAGCVVLGCVQVRHRAGRGREGAGATAGRWTVNRRHRRYAGRM